MASTYSRIVRSFRFLFSINQWRTLLCRSFTFWLVGLDRLLVVPGSGNRQTCNNTFKTTGRYLKTISSNRLKMTSNIKTTGWAWLNSIKTTVRDIKINGTHSKTPSKQPLDFNQRKQNNCHTFMITIKTTVNRCLDCNIH